MKPAAEFRKTFIAGFPRTNMNTTPGDAMMLRILVRLPLSCLGGIVLAIMLNPRLSLSWW